MNVALVWMVSLGMNKHLSEEDIVKLLDAHLKDSNGAEHYAYETIKREMMDVPGVVIAPWDFEIIEFKHGRWYLADDGDGLVCSECGEDFCNIYLEVDRFKYCPNCGAYMRETYDE